MHLTFPRIERRALALPCAFVLAWLLAACAATGGATAAAPDAAASTTTPEGRYGVLVMAHGGIKSWEKEVGDAIAPLREEFPVEIAYGMADAASLQEGVEALEKQGVERIGVVRLFISGESWYERTQQILGLVPGAPAKPATDGAAHAAHGDHAEHGMRMEFWRLESEAQFALSREGLADAPEMDEVLTARARALSRDAAREDVLILAHGPEDDAENARWLQKIDTRAQAMRGALPFRRVQVMSLREDWPEKREQATLEIRDFVQRAGREGGRAIVIPYRVQGFGPYAEALKGLDYVSDGHGLVPHPQVTAWVKRQAEVMRKEGFAEKQR